jgi:hypothetical protein
VTITGNDVQRGVQKAFALTNNSVGARISGNRIDRLIEDEVSKGDTSQVEYQGPAPHGSP